MSQPLKVAMQLFILCTLASCLPATPHLGMNTPIPKSMKGYELYSWNSGGTWNYKLLTGTNRNKSMQEITSTEKTISKDGWVNYFVTGNDELFLLLEQLPEKSFLIWNPTYNPGSNQILFQHPDEETISKVKELCKMKEIELVLNTENS